MLGGQAVEAAAGDHLDAVGRGDALELGANAAGLAPQQDAARLAGLRVEGEVARHGREQAGEVARLDQPTSEPGRSAPSSRMSSNATISARRASVRCSTSRP